MSATTGKQITIIADPQPGTTNTPFPSDKQPAFFPVQFSVSDDYPLAIPKQTAALVAQTEKIIAAQNQLVNAMNAITDKMQGNLKMTTELDIAFSGLATSLTATQLLLSTAVTSNIKSNDVYNGKFNDTLSYKEEISEVNKKSQPATDQIANAVAEANSLTAAAAEENTVNQAIQGVTTGITNWVKSTEFYTSAKKFATDIFDSMTAIIPSSWRGKSNNVKAVSGDSTIGG
jgi:hypothetical protein